MEIRKVVNDDKKEYPKEKQISKKCITNNIPNKWLKAGLSSLVVLTLMRSNIWALSVDPRPFNESIPVAGNSVIYSFPIQICIVVHHISVITFIITGLNILITKIKSKKQNEPKKVKKWVKIAFTISIIMFILSLIIDFYYSFC